MHFHNALSEMYYRHRRAYILQLIVALILICAGLAAIMYSTLEERHAHHWVTWTAISAVGIVGGLLVLGNAFVNKVKCDLLNRESQKLKKDAPTIID